MSTPVLIMVTVNRGYFDNLGATLIVGATLITRRLVLKVVPLESAKYLLSEYVYINIIAASLVLEI